MSTKLLESLRNEAGYKKQSWILNEDLTARCCSLSGGPYCHDIWSITKGCWNSKQ